MPAHQVEKGEERRRNYTKGEGIGRVNLHEKIFIYMTMPLQKNGNASTRDANKKSPARGMRGERERLGELGRKLGCYGVLALPFLHGK